jgi:hypothetical protein
LFERLDGLHAGERGEILEGSRRDLHSNAVVGVLQLADDRAVEPGDVVDDGVLRRLMSPRNDARSARDISRPASAASACATATGSAAISTMTVTRRSGSASAGTNDPSVPDSGAKSRGRAVCAPTGSAMAMASRPITTVTRVFLCTIVPSLSPTWTSVVHDATKPRPGTRGSAHPEEYGGEPVE